LNPKFKTPKLQSSYTHLTCDERRVDDDHVERAAKFRRAWV